MTAPSLLACARQAPDRLARIRLMARTMQEAATGPDEACTFTDLTAAGFTSWEIEAYRDQARALLSGRTLIERSSVSPARLEGAQLVAQARAVRVRTLAASR